MQSLVGSEGDRELVKGLNVGSVVVLGEGNAVVLCNVYMAKPRSRDKVGVKGGLATTRQ